MAFLFYWLVINMFNIYTDFFKTAIMAIGVLQGLWRFVRRCLPIKYSPEKSIFATLGVLILLADYLKRLLSV